MNNLVVESLPAKGRVVSSSPGLRGILHSRLVEAMETGLDLQQPADPLLMPATKPEFGDFQANGAMGLARQLKRPPRQIAEVIVTHLRVDDLCLAPQIAGPGFINLTITPSVLATELVQRLNDPRLGIGEASPAQRVVVDFSSPNIAKEMHVGHLRSTIIGDCIARALEFRGHDVLRLNHLGDWGTQFGMLIAYLQEVAPTALDTAASLDLNDLVLLYRKAKRRFDDDEAFQQRSREAVVRLQSGDPSSTAVWQLLCQQSRQAFQAIYDCLDVKLVERGESFYNSSLQNVVEDLQQLQLLATDDGARCVFLDGIAGKDGRPQPLIVQKRDGGFNYATTDLAAIRQRLGRRDEGGEGAERVIYVTDAGQAGHFEAVFQVARRAGWVPKDGQLEHVAFGLVQGTDGKKLKTRSGATIRLRDLLQEAVDRVRNDLRGRLVEEQREETEDFIEHVATTVGLAAVKYADLSQNRITDYQFSFDKMLALQGNTAPYLLYAYVRIKGIVRKGGILAADQSEQGKISCSANNNRSASNKSTSHNEDYGDASFKVSLQQEQELEEVLKHPTSRSLAWKLLQFNEVVADLEQDLLPNRLCNYLFELSQTFNRFYDQLPVLKAEEPVRSRRLALCHLTARTLKLGLYLLGINTLERM